MLKTGVVLMSTWVCENSETPFHRRNCCFSWDGEVCTELLAEPTFTCSRREKRTSSQLMNWSRCRGSSCGSVQKIERLGSFYGQVGV